ncbi:outer membrane lipoprotein-sorting protein [Spartinivicinus poritis]|uniref:Outer membrane lipoprotein-sorting protein n=1 Tax=Spartinivicinus poritis TaxID=2994640 RepID=A0ABT5UF36_9GAMM|nr:outer membrane lipoprotein-sorting protein [Spartinivicinus sp. A2-2]MDE1464596.1 outer membrane lipoprotein-sorting protein [Spartinivicinus sp. A2-2]
MKPTQWLSRFFLLGWFISLPVFATSDAEALAKRVYERPDGDDRASFGYMVLVEEGHKPRVRGMFSYGKDKSYSDVWSLIRFTSPKDIANTGLLTLDSEAKDSEQWVYLPGLDRVRRISSSRKGGRFVGSDIFYEDLQNRLYTKDNHKILGKAKVNKLDAIILESTPKKADDSAYSKKVSWIHESSLIALKVEYYQDGAAKPMKRLLVNKINKTQGYWTVLESTVTDLDSGHKTIMKVKNVLYDQGLADDMFTVQVLEDPSRETKYRPKQLEQK